MVKFDRTDETRIDELEVQLVAQRVLIEMLLAEIMSRHMQLQPQGIIQRVLTWLDKETETNLAGVPETRVAEIVQDIVASAGARIEED